MAYVQFTSFERLFYLYIEQRLEANPSMSEQQKIRILGICFKSEALTTFMEVYEERTDDEDLSLTEYLSILRKRFVTSTPFAATVTMTQTKQQDNVRVQDFAREFRKHARVAALGPRAEAYIFMSVLRPAILDHILHKFEHGDNPTLSDVVKHAANTEPPPAHQGEAPWACAMLVTCCNAKIEHLLMGGMYLT